MKKKGVAILTTVANFTLYEKTACQFPEGILRFVIDGRNGMHSLNSIFYMFKILKGKGIKWLIMADEDVIFTRADKVFELIEYMEEHDYSVCGIRDGGVIPHRTHNPYSLNTFFSILNFSEVEKIFDKKEITRNHYITSGEFKDNLENLKHPYDVNSLYEPYYGFYFWLRRKGFKFLFLDAQLPFNEDPISNAVYTPSGELLLFHTWYARSYGRNRKHTDRINKVLADLPTQGKPQAEPVIFKDIHFRWQEFLRKNLRKIKLKIENH